MDEMKSNLLQTITDYAKQALRTICFAYKDLQPGDGGPSHEDMDEEGVTEEDLKRALKEVRGKKIIIK